MFRGVSKLGVENGVNGGREEYGDQLWISMVKKKQTEDGMIRGGSAEGEMEGEMGIGRKLEGCTKKVAKYGLYSINTPTLCSVF